MLYKQITKLAVTAGVMSLFITPPAEAETVAAELRNELRQAVISYIDAHSTDGKLLFRNPVNNRSTTYEFTTAHTLVVKVGAQFVICSSFQTAEGKTAYMDFLIDRGEVEAKVLQVFAGKRSVTREMVEAHKLAEGAITAEP